MRIWLAALLAALAAGCAVAPERRPAEDPRAAWQLRQSQLADTTSWQIQGRLSARTAEEGWQASLRWVRERDRHEIDLWGPLGRGHVRISQDRFGAELLDAERNRYRAPSGEALLLDATGWRVPLDGLNYWVLGIPVPQRPAREVLDDAGRLQRLQQLGWSIAFERYERDGTLELPRRLHLRRQAAEGERRPTEADAPLLEVRLVIERFRVP